MLTSRELVQLTWVLSSQPQNFFQSRDMARHLFQGSRAVNDPTVGDYINKILSDSSLIFQQHKESFLDLYENKFLSWLKTHSSNKITGLENFKPNFSNGTTQAFDSFYLRHSKRRFRCFVGEYFYHLKTWNSIGASWSFINSTIDVQQNDAVVISAPFCDTGRLHPEYYDLLRHCSTIGVPVLIDCCYYLISGHIDFLFNHECVDTVCFSLSKAFPVSKYRIGIRYIRPEINDGQSLLSNINYNNNFAAYFGIHLMEKFRSDYIYNTYRKKQEELCQSLPGLELSNCAIFAVGDQLWDQYSRKNLIDQYGLSFDPKLFVNRICLNSVFENWELYKTYENTIKV